MPSAAADSPSSRSIIAPVRIIATGLARPVPAMSGAVPWIGSKMPGPPSPSEAEGASPMPPETEAARSERMSPKRFSVTITSYAVGCSISFIVIESTSWWSSRDVRVLGRHLVGEAMPEAGRVEHVRLVDARQVPAPRLRETEALAQDAADLVDAVAERVERAVRVVPALAEVEASGQLAHDQEVEALDELGPQRADRAAPPAADGAEVRERLHRRAELEDARPRAAPRPLSHLGPPTAPKQHGVGGETGLARVVGIGIAHGVDRRAAEELLGELEREPVRARGALEHAHRGVRDLRPDPVTGKDRDPVAGRSQRPLAGGASGTCACLEPHGRRREADGRKTPGHEGSVAHTIAKG